MKNSKEYSQKVHRLYRSLKRKYPKVKKAVYDQPVDALIYGIIGEKMSDGAARSVIKRFANSFIDWNDLRVSLPKEIVEMLGADTPVTRDTASALSAALMAIFNKYNTVSLEALKKIGKRPAKQALDEIDGVSCFTVDYCMLTSLCGHTIPLTKKMIEYLRNNQLVHPNATQQEIKGFLTRQISAENAYQFYVLLRRESELGRAGTKTPKKKKTGHKTKTAAAAKSKKKSCCAPSCCSFWIPRSRTTSRNSLTIWTSSPKRAHPPRRSCLESGRLRQRSATLLGSVNRAFSTCVCSW